MFEAFPHEGFWFRRKLPFAIGPILPDAAIGDVQRTLTLSCFAVVQDLVLHPWHEGWVYHHI